MVDPALSCVAWGPPWPKHGAGLAGSWLLGVWWGDDRSRDTSACIRAGGLPGERSSATLNIQTVVVGTMEQKNLSALQGRGAVANPTGRFESASLEAFDDGWGSLGLSSEAPTTRVLAENTRRILSQNDSPDLPFRQTINPYKGCEHGCIYCYARPTHAYLGLSPGLDFETRLYSKPAAAKLLRRELSRRAYRPSLIVLGANTDPYQPIERRLGITRELLEVLQEFRHPVAITTKSAGVLRDLDLLAPMASEGLAQVFVSVTTLDPKLSRRMEPRAAAPARRIHAMSALAEAGVPVGVLASPMIPGLNDMELEGILAASREAGAVAAGYILLRLPGEVQSLFQDWLETHYPLKAAAVLERVRQTRSGALNESAFGTRMRGTGTDAELLASRYRLALRRLRYRDRMPSPDFSRFRVPGRAGPQLALAF